MADRGPLNPIQRDSPASPDPEPPQRTREVSPGVYDENWIREWQDEMSHSYRQVMTRLVTTYYGIWPAYKIPEWAAYKTAAHLFSICKNGIRKRIALARHLDERIVLNEGFVDPEGAVLLSRLNIYLSDRVLCFRNKYNLFRHCTQVATRRNVEVTAFLEDLKTHSIAFKNAAHEEMIEVAIAEVSQLKMEIPDDALEGIPEDEEDEDAVGDDDDDEVVVKKDDAISETSRKLVGKKDDDDDDKMDTDKGDVGNDDKMVTDVKGDKDDDEDKMATDVNDDDDKRVTDGKGDKGDDDVKKVTQKGDAGDDDDRMVTGKGDKGDDDKVVTDKDDDDKMVIEKGDAGDDDEKVTDKDNAGGDDKKVTEYDTYDYAKLMADKDDTSYGIDRIPTDTSSDDKMESEKGDTSDDVEKIVTDKEDTSNDDKVVAEKDDAGDDQAEGKKDDDVGKDGKIVTEQEDSEDGWC